MAYQLKEKKVEKLKEVLATNFQTQTIRLASLGGSATWGIAFPEDLHQVNKKIEVVASFESLETPFGSTGRMKLLSIEGYPVIRVPFHGWNTRYPSLEDSLKVFWVLHQLGVKEAIADASVGGITAKPWDVVLADDFVDFHSSSTATKLAAAIGTNAWIRMADPYCPRLKKALLAAANKFKQSGTNLGFHPLGELKTEGVYFSKDLGPFETKAEIALKASLGVSIVGQSTGQEAMMARVARICFGGIYIVANFAEGLPGDWNKEGMDNLYRQCGKSIGTIVLWTLEALVKPHARNCDCALIAEQSSHQGLPVPNA
jgi:5'-methylthioadenosine phosphorylase